MSAPTVVGQSAKAKGSNVKKLTWYRPNFTAADVDKYLATAPPGAFTIRRPPARKGGNPDDMCLSVQAGVKLCNVLLPAVLEGGKSHHKIGKTGTVLFESLVDLVEHGTTNAFNFPSLKGSGMITLDHSAAANADVSAKKLEKASWYRPAFSEEETTKYLTKAPVGAFIIRNPPNASEDETNLCLSVQAGPKICHVLLFNTLQDGKVMWQPGKDGGMGSFDDLTDMVAHCNKKPFVFPSLPGSGKIKLSNASAKKAEATHKKVAAQEATAAKKAAVEASKLQTEAQIAKAEAKAAKEAEAAQLAAAMNAEGIAKKEAAAAEADAKKKAAAAEKEAAAAAAAAEKEAAAAEADAKKEAKAKAAASARRESVEGSKAARAAQLKKEAEEAAKLEDVKNVKFNSVETKEGFSRHNTSTGNEDPDRDIGHIGSSYKREESKPAWANALKKKPSSS